MAFGTPSHIGRDAMLDMTKVLLGRMGPQDCQPTLFGEFICYSHHPLCSSYVCINNVWNY
jgi:hypothetical protein